MKFVLIRHVKNLCVHYRKPGADISDYFNYGFNEETWFKYCERQKRMRIQESGAGLTGLGISVTKVCECMKGIFFLCVCEFMNMYFELFLGYCYILSLLYNEDHFRSIV